MKMKPLLIAFGELKFGCPVCEAELTTDKCSKCGQLIDCDAFEIDVCPAEVLADHRDAEEVKE